LHICLRLRSDPLLTAVMNKPRSEVTNGLLIFLKVVFMKVYTVQATEDELMAIALCQDSVESSGSKAYAEDVRNVENFLIRCRTEGFLFEPSALLLRCQELIDRGDLTLDGFKAIRALTREINAIE